MLASSRRVFVNSTKMSSSNVATAALRRFGSHVQQPLTRTLASVAAAATPSSVTRSASSSSSSSSSSLPSSAAASFSSSAVQAAKEASSSSNAPSFTIPLQVQFDLHRLEEGPATSVTLTRDQLMDMYWKMVLIRRMETAADTLYKQKLIRGFCHLAIGQEAVPVGIEHVFTKDDAIITAYRCHGFTLARGGTVESILAELMGRRTGITLGKGGSMHMFAHNFYGGNGIVGAQVPVGAGIAFAQQYQEVPQVTMALFGDGAANQGQAFEAYNMAKLWNLPCIFACENNRYGMGTAAGRAAASTDYYTRGDYIPGVRINGMDALSVFEAVRWGKAYCVSGKGPLMFEFNTYRYGGHSMSDPGTTYRSRDEIQHMRSTRDPIMGMKTVLLDHGVATEADIKALDKQAKEEVDRAVESAKKAPEPEPSQLWTDIYVPGSEPPFLRGREPEEVHHY